MVSRLSELFSLRPDLQLVYALVDPSPSFPLQQGLDVVPVLVGPGHGGLLHLRGGLAVDPTV